MNLLYSKSYISGSDCNRTNLLEAFNSQDDRTMTTHPDEKLPWQSEIEALKGSFSKVNSTHTEVLFIASISLGLYGIPSP